MQLKAFINSRAKAAAVSLQLMLQCYMLVCVVERVSRSRWRDQVGGKCRWIDRRGCGIRLRKAAEAQKVRLQEARATREEKARQG